MGEGTLEVDNRIPLNRRNPFQSYLIQSMFNKEQVPKTEKEWSAFGETVSKIIDNPKNEKIRELIMEQKYQEALVVLNEILGREEGRKAA
jgi:hypothetical protein